MRNRSPDGRDLRELLESALEGQAEAAATEVATTVVGEVLDTHHPHLPGRVLVKWLDQNASQVEQWLQRERHLSLSKGDRVLLTLPTGWKHWIVTGALSRESCERSPEEANVSVMRLGPGESLQLQDYDGRPLLHVRQGADGPVLELASDNVELRAKRTLKLTADTIELNAAQGGVDLRTDGDAVFRARTIRLN